MARRTKSLVDRSSPTPLLHRTKLWRARQYLQRCTARGQRSAGCNGQKRASGRRALSLPIERGPAGSLRASQAAIPWPVPSNGRSRPELRRFSNCYAECRDHDSAECECDQDSDGQNTLHCWFPTLKATHEMAESGTAASSQRGDTGAEVLTEGTRSTTSTTTPDAAISFAKLGSIAFATAKSAAAPAAFPDLAFATARP